MPVLSIVIPAYNEGEFIGKLIERILAVPVDRLGFEKEIIVVDDGSKDNTGEIARGFAQNSPSSLFYPGSQSVQRKGRASGD
jgi:glycosyltransferase involved in cell wall biosynthesis